MVGDRRIGRFERRGLFERRHRIAEMPGLELAPPERIDDTTIGGTQLGRTSDQRGGFIAPQAAIEQ